MDNLNPKKRILFLIFTFVISTYAIGQDLYEDPYQWRIPGGKYVDPVSFFSLHGYVNALYAGPSKQWMEGATNGLGYPGQMNIPLANTSSFGQDAALWIGSEVSEDISVVLEIHLHKNGSGHHGEFENIDPEDARAYIGLFITEANVRVKLIKDYLNVSAGTFWSVFGIQNKDWLSAQNLFSTIPLASGAYISHYNDIGVRFDGFLNKGNWGVNYVVAVGNGYDEWSIDGFGHADINENKTINGRVSVFPGLGENLNIGLSYGQGLFAKYDHHNVDPNSQGIYDHSFEALGVDLTGKWQNLSLRSYYISSSEQYINDQEKFDLPHTGFMAELKYDFAMDGKFGVQTIIPKFRFDTLDKSQFIQEASDEYQTISAGMNIEIKKNVMFGLDYNWFDEKYNKLDNDRFIARITANF
jgi:hypothetical protein